MGDGALDTVARLRDGVAALQSAPWDLVADDDLLDVVRGLETVRRMLPTVDAALIGELERRGLPATLGARDVRALLRGLLRLHPGEARARVLAADVTATRRTLAGEVLPPVLPAVAAAQAVGTISAQHARVVAEAVDRLPDGVRAERGAEVEASLVEHAQTLDPHSLAVAARRWHDHLDPDGLLPDQAERHRRRDLSITRRADGSAHATAELTAEAAEVLLSALDPLAAPRPTTDQPDDRSAGQRRHDALVEIARRALRTGLPDTGGVTTTVVLTADADDWAAGRGTATTGHGAVVPVRVASEWVDDGTRVMTVFTGGGADGAARADDPRAGGGIAGWTDARRLFSEAQRLAMAVRDGGCTFPDCTVPAAWCEGLHVVAHADGGPTTTANGVLGCRYHHRHTPGWEPMIIDGRAAWVPPAWVDPDRRPRVNVLHRPPASVRQQSEPP